MTFDVKVGLVTDRRELVGRKTDMHFYDTMALRTGQMMMVATATDTVVMRAIGKIDTIQQTRVDEHLQRAVEGGPP